MAKEISIVNVKVPQEVKDEANKLFEELGLNMSTAINMFLKQAVKEQSIPFKVTLRAQKSMNKQK